MSRSRRADSEKTRIAFLPYQAAMWDSMESVWAAAMADDRCEVVVLPLPYDELGPDGQPFRRCPGEALPADVAVRDAASFDLAGFRPHLVYVHNVYDDSNLVTRVDMRFATPRLREIAGAVVYIPYYLTGLRLPVGQHGPSRYDNIDAVVVQTEGHQGQLIPEYRDKGWPLGSPKVDHAITVPDLRISGQGPGSPRATLMLNTSIAEVLHFDERALMRTLGVLDFTARHGDVALVWRPHPLLRSTLVAMRPAFVGVFDQLLALAERTPNILLDRRPDYAWALGITDCCLSMSPSSLTMMFGALGKPVFLLSPDEPAPGASPGPTPTFESWTQIPWVCREESGSATLETFTNYVAAQAHDKDEQRRRFAELLGPLDGQVGARIHRSAMAAVAERNFSRFAPAFR